MLAAKLYLKCQLPRTLRLSYVLSCVCKISTKSVAENRLVYNSSSKSIFSNLAFEEWLYENADLTNTDILLMWQNTPSVVIGRHQNPWLEANVPLLMEGNVILSRRSSGGGAVYHDEGNLNLSFIKSRSRYDRKENLNLVVDALTSKWDIDLKVNERDDIILDGFYKISGTAAKLGRKQSYHHFTLLHSVDKDRLTGMLGSPMQNANSKATKSVPAMVRNLSEAAPSMSIDAMVDVIAKAFLEQARISERISVDPENERQFPIVQDMSQRLQNWDWLIGKTPKFSIQRKFSMPWQTNLPLSIEISINIDKGCVSSLSFDFSVNESYIVELCWQLTNIFDNHFLNMQITPENVEVLLEKYTHFNESLCKGSHEQKIALWVKQCLVTCFKFF